MSADRDRHDRERNRLMAISPGGQAGGTMQDWGGQNEWEIDDVAAGWTHDEQHIIATGTDWSCEACGTVLDEKSPIKAECHYWGVPMAKYEAILDEIEAQEGESARRYFETTAWEPTQASVFEVVVQEASSHPRRLPPAAAAIFATKYLTRMTSRLEVDIEAFIPDAGTDDQESEGNGNRM